MYANFVIVRSKKMAAPSCSSGGASGGAFAATTPEGIAIDVQPGGHVYRQFSQPAVDIRLKQCNNFLADEDPDRYFHFEDKIVEIEDYVDELERENVPRDLNLFKDVQIKVRTHREWRARQKEGPVIADCCAPEAPALKSYSNRLVSTATAMMIDDKNRELRTPSRIRPDRAVFSSIAGADYVEFLKRMREDVVEDHMKGDTSRNLTLIEHRAYGWALNDPALIQHWMHPIRGIPSRALRPMDKNPWYKDPTRTLPDVVRDRPPRGWLPDYLHAREDRINNLLEKSTYTLEEWGELEELLHFHEPKELRTLHDTVARYADDETWSLDVDQDVVDRANDAFDEQFQNWVSTFQAHGVYLLVRLPDPHTIESDLPGVFYVDDGLLNAERKAVLKEANELLQKYRSSAHLTPSEVLSLDTLLSYSKPPDVLEREIASSKATQAYNTDNDNWAVMFGSGDYIRFQREIESLNKTRKENLTTSTTMFTYIRPGEILEPSTMDLYLPWSLIRFPGHAANAISQDLETTDVFAAKTKGAKPPRDYDSKLYMDMAVNPTAKRQVGRLINTIEIELNRLLRLVIDQGHVSTAEFQRLFKLLPQFMPNYVFLPWQRLSEYLEKSSSWDCNEVRKLRGDVKRTILPWLQLLGQNGVSILPLNEIGPSKEISFYKGDSSTNFLGFQDRIFDKKGPTSSLAISDFVISAPIVDDAHYNDQDVVATGSIGEIGITLECEQDASPPLTIDLQDLEDTIKSLLKRRHDQDFTWDENELLVKHLRHIMPPYLIRLDDDLLVLDNRARRARSREDLPFEETQKWWDLWRQWSVNYGGWLNRFFPQDEIDQIHIDRGNAADENHADNRRFKAYNFDDSHLRAVRERGLPLPVTDMDNEAQRYLLESESIEDISEEKKHHFLVTWMRPLWRSRGRALRQELTDLIKQSWRQGKISLEPEDEALIEVNLDIAYTGFLTMLMNSTQPSEPVIKITERVAGEFKIDYVYETLDMTEPQANEIWMDDLLAHKESFHRLAASIRRQEYIAPDEVDFIQQQLSQPLERLGRNKLLGKLYGLLTNSNGFSSDQVKEYVEIETRLLWHWWACENPAFAEGLGFTQCLVDPVDDLVALRPTGTRRLHPEPELIAPPSNQELKGLEIELNNLLAKDRETTTTTQLTETKELDFILIALLPKLLRESKARIDALEARYQEQQGLEAHETVELLANLTGFHTGFAEWKSGLPRYGIFLDENWYSLRQICEACSRARLWRERTYRYPMTSNEFEDPDVKAWHEHYSNLSPSLDRRWIGDADFEKMCLWSELPPNLRDARKLVEDLLDSAIPTAPDYQTIAGHPFTVPPDVVFAQLVAQTEAVVRLGGFVHKYMQWLCQFPSTILQDIKATMGVVYPTDLDFTGLAERRGIQRASIELALNTLATNQEQHRPNDHFRVIDIQGQRYHKLDEEVPLSMPLEPWKRPLEQNPFDYTHKLAKYRQLMDYKYEAARERTLTKIMDFLDPPANYLGPIALADGNTWKEGARQKQAYLANVASKMQQSQFNAPRPLMQQLLSRFSDGLKQAMDETHTLWDEVPLTKDGLNLLLELSGDSWSEIWRPYDQVHTGQAPNVERSLLEEFTEDIEELGDIIPLWRIPQEQISSGSDQTSVDVNDVRQFEQPIYDANMEPQIQGIAVRRLHSFLNQKRLNHVPPLNAWSETQMHRFLARMHRFGRLHYHHVGDIRRVWRIPLTGHPENKYVTNRIDPTAPPPGVTFNATGAAQVTYDAKGTVGPPILQVNKFSYFQQLAYRLGRDCGVCLRVANSPYPQTRECLAEQLRLLTETLADMGDTPQVKDTDITLRNMALQLHKVAPDIAENAGMVFPNQDPAQMTEQQAGQILQMQVLEEINNNWEFRFPENEHVWDFAEQNLEEVERNINGQRAKVKARTRQYFSLRRFPPCCQSDESKALIEKSGPVVQGKPKRAESPERLTRGQRRVQEQEQGVVKTPTKRDRHIQGHKPSFPFGETPYQAAFQSFMMEQDLKDAPEFQTQRESGMNFTEMVRAIPRKLGMKFADEDPPAPADPFALPDIPVDWQPDNISKPRKKAQILEIAKRIPGMPDPSILEHYHSQSEIEDLKRQENWERHVQGVGIANQAIEELTGKRISQLTAVEQNRARMDLGIDLALGEFRPKTPPSAPTDAGNLGNLGPIGTDTERRILRKRVGDSEGSRKEQDVPKKQKMK